MTLGDLEHVLCGGRLHVKLSVVHGSYTADVFAGCALVASGQDTDLEGAIVTALQRLHSIPKPW